MAEDEDNWERYKLVTRVRHSITKSVYTKPFKGSNSLRKRHQRRRPQRLRRHRFRHTHFTSFAGLVPSISRQDGHVRLRCCAPPSHVVDMAVR